MSTHGGTAPGFEAVQEAFQANFDKHGEVGAACCVYVHGRPVVDVWGGVSVASIYSALSTMTKHGWLEQLGDHPGIRAKTRAHRTTEPGRREFHALWRGAIETVDPAHPLAFHVAITLTALVTRESSGKGRAPRSMTVADITVLQ